MSFFRLKCSMHPTQIADRLKYGPEIIELQLFEKDLLHPRHIIKTIHHLKEKGIRVYLHHPMSFEGKFLDIASEDHQMRGYYDWSCQVLADICRKEDVRCVVHPHYSSSASTNFEDESVRREVKNRIKYILRTCGDYFLWENTIEGVFSHRNPFLIEEIIEPLNLSLCFDVSHSFLSVQGNNRRLKHWLEALKSYTSYFHLVDSMGEEHDSLVLGEGKISWRMVAPYLEGKDSIYEIGLDDYNDCTPMVKSAVYFQTIGSKAAYL